MVANGLVRGAWLPVSLDLTNRAVITRHSEKPHPSQPAPLGLPANAKVSPEAHLLKKDSRHPPAGQHPPTLGSASSFVLLDLGAAF